MKIIKDTKRHDKLCQLCVESANSLLSSLKTETKELLNQSMVCVDYSKGDIIYAEGNMPVALMSLVEGKVKIFKFGVGTRQQIVRMATPIGFIGHRGFFADEPHIASAEAIEPSVVCRINSLMVNEIVRANPDFAMNIIRALATDLGFSHRRTVTLTQKHIRGRLADTLFMLGDIYGFEHDGATLKVCLTREDLANLSNMTTSNAIRTLSNFATEGHVELKGKQIKLTNTKALEEIGSCS
ncbi:Crp/Fnr family transcriptional regulator [Bacteroidia bacterium]|nr:Crp/Fnr family transcriptional regulator [Bacteroidia bacterium]